MGAEARFITTLQTKHPEFTLTEIRKVLHHCALELALDRCGDELAGTVERKLRAAWEASHGPKAAKYP